MENTFTIYLDFVGDTYGKQEIGENKYNVEYPDIICNLLSMLQTFFVCE